jgi:hypothetical protein
MSELTPQRVVITPRIELGLVPLAIIAKRYGDIPLGDAVVAILEEWCSENA